MTSVPVADDSVLRTEEGDRMDRVQDVGMGAVVACESSQEVAGRDLAAVQDECCHRCCWVWHCCCLFGIHWYWDCLFSVPVRLAFAVVPPRRGPIPISAGVPPRMLASVGPTI